MPRKVLQWAQCRNSTFLPGISHGIKQKGQQLNRQQALHSLFVKRSALLLINGFLLMPHLGQYMLPVPGRHLSIEVRYLERLIGERNNSMEAMAEGV